MSKTPLLDPSENAPVALVTGARKGIGRYLVERLIQLGYQVVGCSREAIDWSLEGYSHHQTDVSKEAQVQHLFTAIRKQYGRLDVTINNAGVASMNHFMLTPVSMLDRVNAVNIRGTFLVTRESARLMRQNKFGRIINMSTIAVPLSLAGEAIYVASKSAVEALTRVSSRELADFGITVNAIGPTPIETDLIRGIPADKIQALLNQLAIKRLGQPEDVFNLVQFLIKPESNYITGQVIYLGGPL
jgi:3-oxoacyl-[acyl-carrier protein] reductase